MGTTKVVDTAMLLMQNTVSNLRESKAQKAENSFFEVLDCVSGSKPSTDISDGRQTAVEVRKSIQDDSYDKGSSINQSQGASDDDKAISKELSGEKEDIEESKDTTKDRAQEVLDFVAAQLGISTEELLQRFEELQEQIAAILVDELGVSKETILSTMDSLGMTMVDALEPSKLMNLIVTLNGNADVSSVLTDESLYAQFKGILEQLDSLDSRLSKEQLSQIEHALNSLPQQLETHTMNSAQTIQVHENMPAMETNAKEQSIVTNHIGDADFETEAQKDEAAKTIVQGNNVNDSGDSNQNAGTTGHENLQNFSNQLLNATQQGTASVQTAEIFSNAADVEHILNQLVKQIRVQVNADTTSMEMQLHPESYGKLNLHVAVKDGIVTAQFAVENEAVRRALETQIVQLKDSMNEQGLKVESVEVTIESHQFERNHQKDESNSFDEQQKTKHRNINLEEQELFVEDAMTEEEELTRRIMLQNGNRVNYSA